MTLLHSLFAAVLLAAGAAQAQTYTVLCMKTACGRLVLTESPGKLEVDYSYRNNGRGRWFAWTICRFPGRASGRSLPS